MCRCEGREHRTSWCSKCDGEQSRQTPPKPAAPGGLVAYFIGAGLVYLVLTVGVLKIVTWALT